MRLKMKTTATLLIALFMISAYAVAISARPDEYVLQTGAYGTAEMDYHANHGNYVFLSDGGVGLLDDEYNVRTDFGMGRVVIKGVDTLLSAITTLSFDFYYTFSENVIHRDFQAFPYMVLECAREGGDDADLWIVLISTQIQHDAHTNGPMPELNTWLTWNLDVYDLWHSTGEIGDPENGVSLAAMKTGYPSAKVLNVKVAVGEWAMGNYEAITGMVDDIEINGVTYDFEEESDGPVSLIVNTGEVIPVVRISVDKTNVDFGRIDEGSFGQDAVTITNEGTVHVSVSSTFENEEPAGFFTTNLVISPTLPRIIQIDDSRTLTLTLSIPEGTSAGPKTAVLVFEATPVI